MAGTMNPGEINATLNKIRTSAVDSEQEMVNGFNSYKQSLIEHWEDGNATQHAQKLADIVNDLLNNTRQNFRTGVEYLATVGRQLAAEMNVSGDYSFDSSVSFSNATVSSDGVQKLFADGDVGIKPEGVGAADITEAMKSLGSKIEEFKAELNSYMAQAVTAAVSNPGLQGSLKDVANKIATITQTGVDNLYNAVNEAVNQINEEYGATMQQLIQSAPTEG